MDVPMNQEIHKFPQSKYINAVRWISPHSAFEKFIAMALHDTDSDVSSIEIHSLNLSNQPNLNLQSSWCSNSRVSSLKVSQTPNKQIIAASTFEGSLHFLFFHPVDVSLDSELSVTEKSFHSGPISGIDLLSNGSECVTLGEDGRVNLVNLGDSRLNYRRVFDSQGLVSYTAAKWASPTEFVTGGLGFSLQWWDKRKPGGVVSQFKGGWASGNTSGIVHSVDIHQSRKHVCVAGGSLGTVFAWDLRWPQQPIFLSGTGSNELAAHSPSASEVWEVQYDCYKQSSSISNTSSARVLPVLMCSEDGVLAVVEQGEEPIDVLVEPCAINSLDINPQNPSDVICSLEWESVAFITRQ
ncbi:hypothetical protein AQUCO_04800030v1 [Aquilegia coerulea]|uniref:Anaphase-promoting complex subunit 4 WD40 domain-containing protein n=1 Tax=Aquilegia coerulea TaxID=218851 RepID=A0A2G5CKR0_AQUCA|nr:hypothetical protein AQUCO_04800030v1 [Aquilegia coerulea]